jgi:hypothetical protein
MNAPRDWPNAKEKGHSKFCALAQRRLAWMNAPRDWLAQKTEPLKIRAPSAAASAARDECTA